MRQEGPPVLMASGHVIGFRQWVVVYGDLDGFPVLNAATGAATGRGAWWPGRTEAACVKPDHPMRNGELPAHRPGDARCTCGWYAYNRVRPRGPYRPREVVYGAVVGWGLVARHAEGWRAEHARILAFEETAPGQKRTAWSEAYGVPVMTEGELAEFASEFGVQFDDLTVPLFEPAPPRAPAYSRVVAPPVPPNTANPARWTNVMSVSLTPLPPKFRHGMPVLEVGMPPVASRSGVAKRGSVMAKWLNSEFKRVMGVQWQAKGILLHTGRGVYWFAAASGDWYRE